MVERNKRLKPSAAAGQGSGGAAGAENSAGKSTAARIALEKELERVQARLQAHPATRDRLRYEQDGQARAEVQGLRQRIEELEKQLAQ